MGYKEMKRWLEVADSSPEARRSTPVCFIGMPGIGKSTAVYEYAREHGKKVVEIIASQILPNEVSGITMPVKESHSMEVYDHVRLSQLEDGDILFFDELLQAAPQTLQACLTLIQERRMLSGKMLPDILIVGACNYLGSPSQVPLPIRQRFLFIDVHYDADEWCEYMVRKHDIKGVRKVNALEQLAKKVDFHGKEYNVWTPRMIDNVLTKLIAATRTSASCQSTVEAWIRDNFVSNKLFIDIAQDTDEEKVADEFRRYIAEESNWPRTSWMHRDMEWMQKVNEALDDADLLKAMSLLQQNAPEIVEDIQKHLASLDL